MNPDGALADRLALRDIVHAYAAAADRVDGPGAAALFMLDATVTLYLTPGTDEPRVRRGREEIAAMIGGLRRYRATTHVIANHRAAVAGDRAEAETRAIARHLDGDGPVAADHVLHIAYDDAFERADGRWLIAGRVLRVTFSQQLPI